MAKPNPGHFSLAQAETTGMISALITQNVDGLHQQAGSRNVVDLHGRLDRVICLGCRKIIPRSEMDLLLEELNPNIRKDPNVEFTPDGDAEVVGTESFQVPSCDICGGVYKPDVVFFGEAVPTDRVENAMAMLDRAQCLLVAGSSLTVNSGFRFAKLAQKAGKPIVIVNIGPTRADSLATAKIEANTSYALEMLLID